MARKSTLEHRHYQQFAGKKIVKVDLVYLPEYDMIVPSIHFDDNTFAQVWANAAQPEQGPGWLSLHNEDGEPINPTK